MDDVEWERWMALTDEEQEAECDAALAQYDAWIRSLTPRDLYHYFVTTRLESCLRWRSILKTLPIPCFVEHLKERQMALLQLRRERLPGKRSSLTD